MEAALMCVDHSDLYFNIQKHGLGGYGRTERDLPTSGPAAELHGGVRMVAIAMSVRYVSKCMLFYQLL